MKTKTLIFVILFSFTIAYSFSEHERITHNHVKLDKYFNDTSKLTLEEKKFYDRYNVIETKTFYSKTLDAIITSTRY